MSYGYVYKTSNLVNGRIYIGQRKGAFRKSYLGSGILIKKSLNKYGRKNFRLEIVAYAEDRNKLNDLERIIIKEYRKKFGKRFLYNVADGGFGNSGLVGKLNGRYIDGRTKHFPVCEVCGKKLSHRRFTQCHVCSNKSERRIRNLKKNHADFSGVKNPAYRKKWMYNETTGKQARVSDNVIHDYLTRGWKLGMPLSVRRKHGSLLGKFGVNHPKHNMKWVSNLKLNEEKQIKSKDIKKYVSSGWVLGRKVKV